ncbi:MAG: hypothetical protein ACREIF_16320 [Chthoniobacterales bacterium]
MSLFLALLIVLPCLASAQAKPDSTPESSTGIEGTISAGPAQGGPTRQGSASSQPLTNMAFEMKQKDRVVTSFQTDGRGHFRVLVESGHYTVTRKDYHSALGFYGPFEVNVSRGKMTSVHWECDTGLR